MEGKWVGTDWRYWKKTTLEKAIPEPFRD